MSVRQVGLVARSGIFIAGLAGIVVMLWPGLLRYPRNGDHYFVPRVAQNLVEQGGSLGDWLLMSAPRYFPDLLLDVISFSLVGSGGAGIALGSALLVALQWFAVSTIGCRVGLRPSAALVAGGLYCAGCVITGPHYTSFSYIVWHTGTFSIILLCLALAIKRNQRPGPAAASVMVILAALVTASNVLALPILVTGMGTVSLIYLVQNYRAQNFLMRYEGWVRLIAVPAGAAVAGCAAGLALYYQVMPYPFTNPVDASSLNIGVIKNPVLALRAAIATVVTLFEEPVFVIAMVSVIAGLLCLQKSRGLPALIVVAGFWLVTCLVNQGMIELGANNENRYRIMPINGSIAVAALFISALAARWKLVFLLPVIGSGLMFWTYEDDVTTYQLRHQRLAAEVDCLANQLRIFADDRDLLAGKVVGVSDLSATKSFSYLSDGRIRIIATKGRSKSVLPYMQEVPLLLETPVFAIATIEHDERAASKRSAALLSERNALKQYGEPAARYPCETRVVLHYPAGLKITPPRSLGLSAR